MKLTSEIGRIRRGPERVVDRQQALAAARAFENRAEKIRPAGAKDVAAAHDDRPRAGDLRAALAIEFRRRVDALRVRLIALSVKAVLVSVANVIGRDGNQQCPGTATSQRQQLWPARVYVLGALRIKLAAVNVSPCAAVDDHVRTLAIESRIDF